MSSVDVALVSLYVSKTDVILLVRRHDTWHADNMWHYVCVCACVHHVTCQCHRFIKSIFSLNKMKD